jgi:hypothetical protein
MIHPTAMKYARLIAFAFLLLVVCTLPAQQERQYYISFLARNASLRPFSIGGHAFVAWAIAEGDSAITSDKILGFFPNEGGNLLTAIAEKRRGRVVKGFRTNSKNLYLRHFSIAVDSSTWQDTQCLGDIWNYQPYNLFTRNCVHFLDELAQQCDLERPRTYTWLFHFPKKPYKYLRQLHRKNKKRAVRIGVMRYES